MSRKQIAEFLHTWNTEAQSSFQVPPPPNGGTVTSGRLNLENFKSLTGQLFCDKLGTLIVRFRATPGGAIVYTQTIPQDLSQSNFTFSWNDEPIQAPYVEFLFTNTSGADATTFRAENVAKAT